MTATATTRSILPNFTAYFLLDASHTQAELPHGTTGAAARSADWLRRLMG